MLFLFLCISCLCVLCLCAIFVLYILCNICYVILNICYLYSCVFQGFVYYVCVLLLYCTFYAINIWYFKYMLFLFLCISCLCVLCLCAIFVLYILCNICYVILNICYLYSCVFQGFVYYVCVLFLYCTFYAIYVMLF